jgi:hypothetical protein
MSALTDEQVCALIDVAEAAAALFRPPHRRGAGIVLDVKERYDYEQLRKALHNPACPVEIGEEWT